MQLFEKQRFTFGKQIFYHFEVPLYTGHFVEYRLVNIW